MSRKYDLFTHEKIKKTIKTLKITLIEFNKFTDLSKIKKTSQVCNIFFQPKNSKPIFLLPLFI